MPRFIEVVDYQEEWPLRYEKEAELLRAVFDKALVAIHHVGSTSISGMRAKPVIDILVEIRSEIDVDLFYPGMEQLGYDCRGECLDAVVPGTPGRYYFSKDKNGKRYCHVHVCHVGHFQISELLVLRDYLCEHPNEAARYGNLKSHLARQFANDNVKYMRGKDKFIRQLVGKAMEWRGPNKPAALIASSFGEAL